MSQARRRTSDPLLPRWMLVAAPVLALAALIVTVVLALTADDEEEAPASSFSPYVADVHDAFEPAGDALLRLADVSGRWLDGDASDDDLAGALDDAEEVLPRVRAELASLEEPEGAAPAGRFYVASAALYEQVVQAHRAALAADGAERTERNLLARRVRTLADRTYDRARQIVDPTGPDPEGVTLFRSAPVPIWEEEGLAPGPAAGDAGSSFDVQAAERARGGNERAYRQALQLLVIGEAARARALGLDDLATDLELVASEMKG